MKFPRGSRGQLPLWLLAAAAVSPGFGQTCSHQPTYTPVGAVSLFRNGALLKTMDFAVTPVSGSTRPSYSPIRFADQDAITMLYSRAAPLMLPLTPPVQYWGYLPVREEWVCTGNLNPPPPPVAIMRQQCIGNGPTWNCAGIELWTVTVSGATQYYSVTPASPDAKALPVCPNPPVPGVSCYQPAAIGDPPLALGLPPSGPVGDFVVLLDPAAVTPMCFAVPRDNHDLCGDLHFTGDAIGQ